MNGEMIISEENLRSVSNVVMRRADALNQDIITYCSILESLMNNALLDGEFREAMQVYLMAARKMKHHPKIIAQKMKQLTGDYLAQVDVDDQFIY